MNTKQTHTPVFATTLGLALCAGLLPVTGCNLSKQGGGHEEVGAQVAPLFGPGGVLMDLELWYSADVGITAPGGTVTTWNDRAANGNHLTATGGNEPSLVDSSLNFNPGVSFDAAQWLERATGVNAPGLNGTAEKTAFFVISGSSNGGSALYLGRSTPINQRNIAYGWSTTDSDGLNPGDHHAAYVSGPTPTFNGKWASKTASATLAETHIYRFDNSNGDLLSQFIPAVDGVPGSPLVVPSANSDFAPDLIPFHIVVGAKRAVGGGGFDTHFDGTLHEALVFSWDLNGAEMARVEANLGLKYGISLSQDYVASDASTVFWDVLGHTTYNNDIAGIGRDDGGEVLQKQARSASEDRLVTIGLGNIAATNAANTGTFGSDLSFMMWGNNDGNTSMDVAYTGTPSHRMGRVWQINETGSVGAVQVCIPPSAGMTHLLVNNTDASFTTGTVEFPLSVVGADYCTDMGDFADNAFFTFGTSQCGNGTIDMGESCDDGVQNGPGGACSATCLLNDGESCTNSGACNSGFCNTTSGLCATATCVDMFMNQDETDVDCGGAICSTCADGMMCVMNSDCMSMVCDTMSTNTCLMATCGDMVQNGDETDEDCGGSCGSTCDTGEDCASNNDCISLVCDSGMTDTCLAATCMDMVQNGDESDVDCGGSCGATCANGDACSADSDCMSMHCDSNLCATEPVDAGMPDSGMADGGTGDAGMGDGGAGDGGANNGDAGTPVPSAGAIGGGGCTVAAGNEQAPSAPSQIAFWVVAALFAVRRKRFSAHKRG